MVDEDLNDSVTEEEEIELEPEQEQVLKYIMLGQQFEGLLQYSRFQDFINANYDVHRVVRDKTITFEVLEVPAVQANERLQTRVRARMKDASPIVTASPADLSKLKL